MRGTAGFGERLGSRRRCVLLAIRTARARTGSTPCGTGAVDMIFDDEERVADASDFGAWVDSRVDPGPVVDDDFQLIGVGVRRRPGVGRVWEGASRDEKSRLLTIPDVMA